MQVDRGCVCGLTSVAVCDTCNACVRVCCTCIFSTAEQLHMGITSTVFAGALLWDLHALRLACCPCRCCCFCYCLLLQELMRDQPMPALTALQQLQLKQLQEQQNALKEAQQQQQAAAAAALAQQQQQQAAQQYQLLNQQRGLLASGGVAGVGGYGGGMLF